MNGAIGPALLFGRNSYNISGIATMYLSLDIRYHVNSTYALQFGINGTANITILSSTGYGINAQVGVVF